MNELYEQIAESVVNGMADDVENLVQRAINQGKKPKDIINNALVVGMNEVGQLFKNFEMFVPEVLIASQAMNKGMELVKPLLKEGDVQKSGKVVFATSRGDLHDIGKKLVMMLMESSGYEVIDLGVDVKPEEIIRAVKEHRPNIVGMSSMLTTTMPAMKETVDLLKENSLYDNLKVMIGGAPVTEKYAEEIDAYYSNSASSAIELANKLVSNMNKAV